jgi:hypothetical protein
MNAPGPDITFRGRLMRLSLSLTAGLLVLGLATAVAVWGHDYYRLGPAARPFHVHHDLLRPSGRAGLTFGTVATVLFVLNLGYLVRKRLIHIRWLGSLRTWMSFHVVTGLTGGSLIVLHSAFAPSSALAILALVALAITLLSGMIGRYLYAKVPRSLEGRELELEQVRERLHACRHQLEDAGVSADWLRPGPSTPGQDLSKGFLTSLRIVLRGDRPGRQDYRRLRRNLLESPDLRASAAHLLPLARMYFRHQHWLARYQELRNLLARWRFFHRWLAILMLAVAAFHIGLAVRFGDLWFLGGTP